MPGGSDRLSPGQVDTVLEAAVLGAAWAFEALYRHFAPAVVGYLRVQGVWDPEDLSSEVFLAVFQGLSAFTGGAGEFRTWLFAITYRKVIDDRRRSSRRPLPAGSAGAVAAASGDDTESAVMAGLEAERVAQLCQQLSADQRDVILLRLLGDLSVEETASAIGKSASAVNALQHRGLQALKKVLNSEISAQAAWQ